MLYLIICALNEEKALPQLLDDIAQIKKDLDMHVVFVDDGSTDNSLDIVKNRSGGLPVKIIKNPENLGLGSSIRRALTLICPDALETDFIATMDADNTHSVCYLREMLAAADKTSSDLVIASRFITGGGESGVPCARKAIANTARSLFRLRYGSINNIKDLTSGFRLYRARCLCKILPELRSCGFAIQLEALLKLSKKGASAIELPFFLKYEKKQSKSRFSLIKSIKEYLPLIMGVG
ncbi:glycosyltransferase [Elusimicrobiota bacterium]